MSSSNFIKYKYKSATKFCMEQILKKPMSRRSFLKAAAGTIVAGSFFLKFLGTEKKISEKPRSFGSGAYGK